ncbi:MAG: FAD-dependent oxidoreductase [Thermoflavifilum sp.]|nr:FAD-dependent oxidoreductase [Thermoflavifilum sp.]
MGFFILWILMILSISAQAQISSVTKHVDVLVVGGGTGGVAAGIESARNGINTLIVESTPWLGGMLTSAGVSATDGNDKLPSGLWEEFRQALYKHYGGEDKLSTGWVSNMLFEPHVGDSIFKAFAKREKYLQVIYEYHPIKVFTHHNKVTGVVFEGKNGEKLIVYAKITIDATELGDVFAMAGCPYAIGMDAKYQTGESLAVDTPNHIIQDLTYVAILKDYGNQPHDTFPKPKNYDPKDFYCACKNDYCTNTIYDCDKMLSYGRLPNNKYMINWPLHGNDIYINVVDSPDKVREKYYQLAKEKTLSFVYFIQHELGYKHLDLANDEYPTPDRLPFIPYHREGRRVEGIVQFKLQELQNRYVDHLYRTSISVGDYPIDQHHSQNPQAPKRNFPHIPSFSVPIGSLIPKNMDGLIVAEKGISVTNIANGATRLQPCVLLTGQAAGALASLCVKHNIQPREISIREVQSLLLSQKCYLLPIIDVSPNDRAFGAIQRVCLTGIMKIFGVPYNWENQSWFYPNRPISEYELMEGLKEFYQKGLSFYGASGKNITISSFINLLKAINVSLSITDVKNFLAGYLNTDRIDDNMELNRELVAIIIDKFLDPFSLNIDFKGNIVIHHE